MTNDLEVLRLIRSHYAAGPFIQPEKIAALDAALALMEREAAQGEVSEVTRQLIERDTRGRAKYGVTLDRADLSLANWLQHMAEELMDAAGYALAAKRESLAPPVSAAPAGEGRFTPTGSPQECGTVEEAVLLAERTIWQDDEGVRWVPEAAYQRMVSEVERLETPAPSPQQSGEAGIPPEAVQAEGGLLVSAGQWVIPNPFGCRVVDERMAYGWNQCRLAMIERKYPAPTQPAAGEELIEATEALMAWCVKNVNNWHFPQYDTAHRAIQNAKVAALTAAGKGA